MKKRTRLYVLSCIVALVIGAVGGGSYSNYMSRRQQLIDFEKYSFATFAGTLISAQRDMKESTSNPTTPLERAYQVNFKVDVGQSWVLWESMQPELIAEGLPSEKVQQINSGLQIVYNNILPPGSSEDQPDSVQRAREWIATLYSSLYPNSGKGPAPSNAVLLSRLKSNISVITSKYESFKSDGNFQVGSIFPGAYYETREKATERS